MGAKKKTRELADTLSAYPGLSVGAVDFPTWFGLWLNLERVRLAQAVAVARGVGLASSGEPVDAAFCDAVTLTAAEADEMKFQSDAARARARAVAARWGR